jgi:hypothetical protein
MTMNANKTRVTPEEVEEWYRKSGLAPAFGKWADFKNRRACALTARFVASRPDAWEAWKRKHNLERYAEKTAQKVYGRNYVRGFIRGWDGRTLGRGYPEYVRGYKDGARVAVEIFVPEDAHRWGGSI